MSQTEQPEVYTHKLSYLMDLFHAATDINFLQIPFFLSVVEVQLKFELGNMMMSLSYTITCTSTGGTVLQSSFTGGCSPLQ